MNRRQFLQAAGGAALTLTATSSQAAAALGDMKKRVGLIGTGWYGKCDLFRLLQVAPAEVVSLCDVDRRSLEDAGEQVAARQGSRGKPRLYGDYREMLKEKDLDLVLIATPDHWHALPMIEAVKAGADVYVEKPTGVDAVESAAMLAAARKYGRVVQVGAQCRSAPHLIEARDRFVRDGRLGSIRHVEICCYWHMRSPDTRATAPDSAPPADLDYEMWTGPAPMRPFNRIVHPRGWRAFMEYGNGIMGDMGVHMLDMVRWMLQLGWPQAVASWGGILNDRASRANITDTQTATFDYPDFQVVWNHRTWGRTEDPEYPWAAIIHGEKGTLKASVSRYDFIPADGGPVVHKDAVIELDRYPEERSEMDLDHHAAPAIRGHMKDLLAAIAGRSTPVADIEQGHISSTSCILANLSLQLGRTLTWDAANSRVIGDDEANRLLQRPYRAPWRHPDPATV